MFDIGFAELMLLSLVGLLVLGPERLPRVARTLGGLARRARSSWSSLKRSIDEEMRAQDLQKPMHDLKNEFRSTAEDLREGIQSIADPESLSGKPPEKAEKPDD